MQNEIERILTDTYPEPQYEMLRHYILQNCENVFDLKNFDITILYFIPGIDIKDMPEIQSRFTNLLISSNSAEDVLLNRIEEENSSEKPNTTGNEESSTIHVPRFHVPVEFLLDQFKKGDLFARNLKNNGICFSSELSDLDFTVDKQQGIGLSSLYELQCAFHLIKEIMTKFQTLFIPVQYFIDNGIINFGNVSQGDDTVFDILYCQENTIQQSLLNAPLKSFSNYTFETLWNQLLCCYGYSNNSLDCKTILECLFKTNKKAITGGLNLTKSGIVTLADFLKITFNDCVKLSSASERVATAIWDTLNSEISNNSSEAFVEKPVLKIFPSFHSIPILSFPFEKTDQEFLSVRGFTKIEELDGIVDPEVYLVAVKHQQLLSQDPVIVFSNNFNELSEKRKTVIVRRGKGDTLETIAQSFINEDTGEQVTRERVRQIETKAVNYLYKSASILATCLLCNNEGTIDRPEVFDMLKSEDLCYSFFVCLREMETTVKYFRFCDKFISFKYSIELLPEIAKTIARDVIGNYCHVSEKKEQIEEFLAENNLTCFSSEDLVNYLTVECGFCLYGDLLAESRKYGYICHDIIMRFFDYDIKLDMSDNNPDMDRLRSLAMSEYGFELPDNRSICSRLSSDTNLFCLCDRGRYIPVEKVDIDEYAIEAINSYIKERPEPCLYYHEIFENLKGLLMLHSTVTNRHYLHGAMMLFCPDEYQYGRDKLTKIGEKSVSIDNRVLDFLKQQENPIFLKDLKAKFEEFPHWVIEQVVGRQPNIVMNYDSSVEYYNYDDIKEEDCLSIISGIENVITKYHGFITGKRLFPELIKDGFGDLLEKYRLRTWPLLVPLVRKYDNYSKIITRRTQFIDRTVFGEMPSLVDIFFRINSEKEFYTSSDLTEFVEWISNSSSDYYQIRSRVQSELLNRCCRISSDTLIKPEVFNNLFFPIIDSFDSYIEQQINIYGFIGTYNIFNYAGLPKLEYCDWNSFLIETIISKCDTDYELLFPSARDFRYTTSIIVKKGTYKTYLEVAESIITKSSISSFEDKNSLGSFLIDHGLRYNISEQELMESKILQQNSRGVIFVSR